MKPRPAGRPRKYKDDAERQRACRERKASRNQDQVSRNIARQQVVLSLFPGADLFGRAFEALGFCVVRGPELLLGQDIRDFHVPRGRFDGIIGGPPCQAFSRAAITGTDAVDLIPEFIRIVEESRPAWAVMENVPEARKACHVWPSIILSDWNCGGNTFRRRCFWFNGVPLPTLPARRAGKPEYSVLAMSWNTQKPLSSRHAAPLSAERAAELQGYPGLGRMLFENLPGGQATRGDWKGVSLRSRNVFAVHVLGNGVPAALGNFVARHVLSNL